MNIENLYRELKEIRETLGEIRVSTIRNTDSLDYHIRRTDLLEKKLELMEKDLLRFRGFISIGGWVVGICATIITLIAKLYPAFHL